MWCNGVSPHPTEFYRQCKSLCVVRFRDEVGNDDMCQAIHADQYRMLKCGSAYLIRVVRFLFLQELVQYYQQNSLELSFPEVPTVLLIPYKDAVARYTGKC